MTASHFPASLNFRACEIGMAAMSITAWLAYRSKRVVKSPSD
jgi:hypothetical protein